MLISLRAYRCEFISNRFFSSNSTVPCSPGNSCISSCCTAQVSSLWLFQRVGEAANLGFEGICVFSASSFPFHSCVCGGDGPDIRWRGGSRFLCPHQLLSYFLPPFRLRLYSSCRSQISCTPF